MYPSVSGRGLSRVGVGDGGLCGGGVGRGGGVGGFFSVICSSLS